MSKPYYEDAASGIVIYCGDCYEIVPQLSIRPAALITDPPYGIDLHTENKTGHRGNACPAGDYPKVHGDDKPFDPSPWLSYPTIVLFGANHFASRLPSASRWLVWDKRDGMTSNDQADCEIAWTNIRGPARLFRHRWNGMIKDSERDERRRHPTQKPVSLMQWVLRLADLERGSLVLDPFMGIGSTLIAAKQCALRAIGIEIVERYCEIAAKRLAQGVLWGIGGAA
jgi:site-specific DNA-methyltransferase (adenine-specific)